jgi:hypothetical protein
MSTLTVPTATISCPPPSPILFPATMRNSRLDVPVTLASPRIGLQARWVSVRRRRARPSRDALDGDRLTVSIVGILPPAP